jgi:hypothetical protein|eukprot:COSAG02_NODE_2855_length_7889_cov_3.123363_5_plen_62_part_00
MLASQYPELRARLNRFATVGEKLLSKKNVSQTEKDIIKLYVSKLVALFSPHSQMYSTSTNT